MTPSRYCQKSSVRPHRVHTVIQYICLPILVNNNIVETFTFSRASASMLLIWFTFTQKKKKIIAITSGLSTVSYGRNMFRKKSTFIQMIIVYLCVVVYLPTTQCLYNWVLFNPIFNRFVYTPNEYIHITLKFLFDMFYWVTNHTKTYENLYSD